MINNVVLVGRLTKEVELKTTASGIATVRFNLAVERNFKNASGDRETDFISCVMWRKAAENFAQFARKGALIAIEGSVQTDNYENQQGQRVYTTYILSEKFKLLESKKTADNSLQQSGHTNTFNYRQNQNTVPGFPSSNMLGASVEINDDEFPF